MAALVLGGAVVALFLFWRFWFFFRNPRRDVPKNDDHILSPADGRVVYVRPVEPGQEIFSVKGVLVVLPLASVTDWLLRTTATLSRLTLPVPPRTTLMVLSTS